jgi:putative hydrolase of the HAD superfamily
VTLIAFDIDDTLYLERDYVASGFVAVGDYVSSRLGVSDFADRAWELFAKGARRTIFNDVLTELDIEQSQGLLEALVETYRRHSPSIQLLGDAREALDTTGRYARLAVVTDGPSHSQWAKVRALGLIRWTRHIVVTADLGPQFVKPSPLAFLSLQETLSEHPSSCYYVADNPLKDFSGPKRLGWTTLRVRRPGSLHEAKDSATDVDDEVASLDEVSKNLPWTSGS